MCWDEFRVLRNELRVHGGGDDGGGGQCEDTAAVLAARAELLVLRARVLAPIGQALSHRPLVLCWRYVEWWRYPVGVFLSVSQYSVRELSIIMRLSISNKQGVSNKGI